MRGIYINRFISLFLAFLIFILGSSTGTAVEILVQPGESIQAAVNNTSSGDVIIVKPGNYTENIVIGTQNLTIMSDSGNPEDTVITANNPGANVFRIWANNTTISGFKVRSAQHARVTGIYLTGCSYCDICNNDLSENYLGLYLSNSKNNTISDNKMNLSGKYGVQLMHSEGNVLSNNSVDSNHHGVVLENNCSDNNLTGNLVGSNAGFGFYLINSSSNNLSNNTISRNDMGIYLTNSNLSIISENSLFENIRYGMWISHSNYSLISGNAVKESNWGIRLNYTDNSTLSGNILAFNYVSGLSMCPACDNNTIFNNYLNNTLNVHVGNRRNTWNTVKKTGTNIVGGPYMGGNFWASPDGTGFSQTAPDRDKNGIADMKYNGTNVTDYLPLVPVSDPQQELPVTDPGTDFINPGINPADSGAELETSSPDELTDLTASKTTENSGPAGSLNNDSAGKAVYHRL
ncbi:cell surface protein [Methanosarcina sp. MSH10X1]|uniref:right-handed parallel beta-helix repeat-containing protein n=1 Tax=Methanosarcina sp. MSH10X1 TaxID=2507075 RepID=UPI000FFB5D49|nr:NosD domain-containing protein [Methanosarcina sp. MSH10X1]RXA17410.1 cell surface protein [Methanosarcina sp. MSH10X1]